MCVHVIHVYQDFLCFSLQSIEQVIVEQVKLELKEDVTVKASQPKITATAATATNTMMGFQSTTVQTDITATENKLPAWLIAVSVVTGFAVLAFTITIAGIIIKKRM